MILKGSKFQRCKKREREMMMKMAKMKMMKMIKMTKKILRQIPRMIVKKNPSQALSGTNGGFA